MSEHPRKVKNPLLTAAGQAFPFEGYSSNPLLMPVTPVTPATPAILRDVASEENSSPIPAVVAPAEITRQGVEFPVGQESATISQVETARRETSDQPSSRQGYFTSILSSLPNLSLSSITGDASQAQISGNPQQTIPANPGAPRDPGIHAFPQNPYGATTTTGSFVAKDPIREIPPKFSQGFTETGLSGPPVTSGSPRPPPTVPTLPPTSGPGSYRLGNQRRLKYAPPPDLTSNNPKQYSGAENFFSPVQQPTAPSEYLIPSTSLSSQSNPGPLSTPNLPTSSHTSQSFTSGFSGSGSPGIPFSSSNSRAGNLPSLVIPNRSTSAEVSSSAPREIPSRFPETATPQNTPANASFAGFALNYATRPEVPTGSGETKIFSVPKIAEGLTFEVPSSAYAKSTVPNFGGIIEPNTSETRSTSGPEDNSFTAITAAKVTAKLENLLAERAENSIVTPEISSIINEESKPEEKNSNLWRSESIKNDKKSEESEELADIDLTTNETISEVPSPKSNPDSQASALDFPPTLSNETFARHDSHASTPPNISSKSSSVREATPNPPETLPRASNFFTIGNEPRKQNLTYSEPTTSQFYNPQSANINIQSSFFVPPATLDNDPQKNLQFFNAADSQNSTVQPVPTFYNPGEFPTSSPRPFPAFSTSSISAPQQSAHFTQSPFSNVLSSSPPEFSSDGSFVATAMPEPTGTATLNPVQLSVSPGFGRSNTDTVPPSLQSLAGGSSERRMPYRPVYHHWFYRKEVENKVLWLPFSMQDSLSLEEVFNSSEITPETTVATDGGRYDVNILRRSRTPVYWSGSSTEVRRSSWFYKGSMESRYVPYEENVSARLEEEFKQACITDNWNRRVELNNGEYIIFHSSTVQVHHMPATSPELAASWGNSADSETGTYLQGAGSRPKVVKRGVDEFNIDEGEPEKIDHLLFVVHGIGSVCDLKFRTVEEVVDEFRRISVQLVQSHYRSASMHGVVNRIEVLPISWHTTLHSEDTGIDKKLRAITLESIPKLRHFTNDTLLDILFYTSPIYCQTIMQTVGTEMNRLYSLFKERNSNFDGSVYLGGHSLGSLILFDLLCHQKPPAKESRDETDPTPQSDSKLEDDVVESLKPMGAPVLKRRLSKKVSYMMGAAGTGQPFINYPQLSFHPRAFFALGSPIGMFVTVRGIDTLGENFALPTCPAFFNVFHPFDPVAYRVEGLINPDAHKYRPMLIPHHKGRKRMHLELKETMARVGADLKQRLLDSVRSTWNSVYQLAMFHRPDNQSLEQEIVKVVEEQMQKSPSVHEQQPDDDGGADFRVGRLNGGRRIDYVLQEAPFEYINEYIFALTSHVCYWESEDTMLVILKEIYGGNGIQADAQMPVQTLTTERVTPSPSPSMATISGVSSPGQNPLASTSPMGYDPTAPIMNKPVGPPPISGFVRKS